jgi:hypothetical protein
MNTFLEDRVYEYISSKTFKYMGRIHDLSFRLNFKVKRILTQLFN